MIKRWIIPITGFTQDIGRASGFDKLWLKLRPFASETTSVITPQRWRANFDSLADFIGRHSEDDPEILIAAYSWGCGHGFLQLAKELGDRGLKIRRAILCDPVYHSWWRLWRALYFSPDIKIPRNVGRVSWLWQKRNRPRGTHLRLSRGADTVIDKPVLCNRTHAWMDDAPEFHKMVLDAVTEVNNAGGSTGSGQ